jgi:hypothetical protein
VCPGALVHPGFEGYRRSCGKAYRRKYVTTALPTFGIQSFPGRLAIHWRTLPGTIFVASLRDLVGWMIISLPAPRRRKQERCEGGATMRSVWGSISVESRVRILRSFTFGNWLRMTVRGHQPLLSGKAAGGLELPCRFEPGVAKFLHTTSFRLVCRRLARPMVHPFPWRSHPS